MIQRSLCVLISFLYYDTVTLSKITLIDNLYSIDIVR